MDRIAEAMKALAAMADDMPERVKTPWSEGAWSYATDNRAAIRAFRMTEFGERPANVETAASLDAIVDGPAGPTWYDIPDLPPAPGPVECGACHGKKRAKCGACHGDGEVAWEFRYASRTYDMNSDCPVCYGAGRCECENCHGAGTITPEEAPVEIGPAIFNPAYLRILATLPGCQIAPIDAQTAAVFRFTGGSGVVMPIRR